MLRPYWLFTNALLIWARRLKAPGPELALLQHELDCERQTSAQLREAAGVAQRDRDGYQAACRTYREATYAYREKIAVLEILCGGP